MKKITIFHLLTLSACLSLSAQTVVHSYLFNSGSVEDQTGSLDLNAAPSSVTFNTESNISYASFDGTATSLLRGDGVGFVAGESFSTSFWVRNSDWSRTNMPNGTGLISTTNNANNGNAAGFWEFEISGNINNNTGTRWNGKVTPGGAGFNVGSTLPSDNTWTLFTFEFNAATTTGTTWYQDGTSTNSTNLGNDVLFTDLLIGANKFGSNNGFNGDIAEVIVRDGAGWDATAQAALFAAGPTAIPEPSSIVLMGLCAVSLYLFRRRP